MEYAIHVITTAGSDFGFVGIIDAESKPEAGKKLGLTCDGAEPVWLTPNGDLVSFEEMPRKVEDYEQLAERIIQARFNRNRTPKQTVG